VTKHCTNCGAVLAPGGAFCASCGTATGSVSAAAALPVAKKLTNRNGCITAIVVVVLLILGIAYLGNSGSNPGVSTSSGPQLGLLSFSCSTSFGYDTCTGEVKNLTSSSLKNVEAIATWRDSAGSVQRTDDALIDLNPILAGQTSTFKTIGTTNPSLKSASVQFKDLLGGSIATRDDRH
jgi:hypothetical protein